MRTLFFFLLLANLTLLGYVALDNASRGERSRLESQVQPEKIRLLTAQEVTALGPEKAAALGEVCAQWGPLTEIERIRALADLEPLGIRSLVSERRIDTDLAANGRPASPATVLVIRDPPAAALARLRDLGPAYPGADIRIGSCQRP